MLLVRSSSVAAAILLFAACSGSPPPPPPAATRPIPSVKLVLAEGMIDDIDLRIAAPFRTEGPIDSTGRYRLRPRSGDAPRRYQIGQFLRHADELLIWCGPEASPRTLGFAVSAATERRVEDAQMQRIGLQRKQSNGVIEAPGPLAGHLAFSTNRDDCLIAGPWMIRVFDDSLLSQLRIGDGSSLAKHGEDLVAANEHDAARALIVALHDTGEPQIREIAKQIGRAFVKQNEAFEQRAEDAWLVAKEKLLSADYGPAIRQAMEQPSKVPGLVDAEGKPLESVSYWPQRMRGTLITRLKKDIAARSRNEVPMMHALLDLVQQHWPSNGKYLTGADYLASTVKKAMAAKTPEQLAKACSGYYHYADDDDDARDWARALTRASRERNRTLLNNAAQAAPAGSLRHFACKQLASLNKPAGLRDVASTLQDLAKLEDAKTALAFAPWFSQRDRRARMQATALDSEVLARASRLIDTAHDRAIADGATVTAACWLLLKHTFTATEAPAPMWSYDALKSSDETNLARARKLVSEALLDIAPLCANNTGIADDLLTGRLARSWPLTRQLGLDIGPTRSLHKHVNGDTPFEDQQEDHLATHTKPWSWQQRGAKRLLFDRNPLTWERLGTHFVGEKLTAQSKELKKRRDSIVTRSDSLTARGNKYKAQAEAHQTALAELEDAMQNQSITQSSARSRAKAIDARADELNSIRNELNKESNALQALIDAYNVDVRAYMNSKSEEQSDRHAELDAKLAASMNALLDQRLATWAKGRPENDLLWMRWLLGRASKDFRGFHISLPRNAQRVARELDDDGRQVLRKRGRGNVGRALAAHWDNLYENKHPDRVERTRKLLDEYLRIFGMDPAFTHVFMKASHGSELMDEVLTDSERADIKVRARKLMQDYNEHMRKVNKK